MDQARTAQAAARAGDDAPIRSGGDLREAEGRRWSAWMAAAQAGDESAYRELLEEVYDCIERYTRTMLRDASAVDDCVQEVLLAVHRARATYDPSRAFRPWLFAIARNKVFDVARRRKRAPEDLLADFDMTGAAAVDPTVRADVARLLEQLPEKYREAVILTQIEGFPGPEAAAIIGITSVALRTRVHRALKLLKQAAHDVPIPPDQGQPDSSRPTRTAG